MILETFEDSWKASVTLCAVVGIKLSLERVQEKEQSNLS